PPPSRSTLFPYTTLFRSEDVAGKLLADEENPGQLAFDLQRHDQRRLDRVELALGRLEVRRDLGIQLDLFLHQHPTRHGVLRDGRSEEHTSELQSRGHLVC